jgi:hypothetical protein
MRLTAPVRAEDIQNMILHPDRTAELEELSKTTGSIVRANYAALQITKNQGAARDTVVIMHVSPGVFAPKEAPSTGLHEIRDLYRQVYHRDPGIRPHLSAALDRVEQNTADELVGWVNALVRETRLYGITMTTASTVLQECKTSTDLLQLWPLLTKYMARVPPWGERFNNPAKILKRMQKTLPEHLRKHVAVAETFILGAQMLPEQVSEGKKVYVADVSWVREPGDKV